MNNIDGLSWKLRLTKIVQITWKKKERWIDWWQIEVKNEHKKELKSINATEMMRDWSITLRIQNKKLSIISEKLFSSMDIGLDGQH